MDWKTCAIEDLRRYNLIKIGIINSKERLALLNSVIENSLVTGKKKSSRKNSDYINALVKADKLQQNISSARNMTKLIERGLNSLTSEERQILDQCYMQSSSKPTTIISKEIGLSSRSLYRIRDEALAKFTLAMYGVCTS